MQQARVECSSIKTNQGILLDFADFILRKRPEYDVMAAIVGCGIVADILSLLEPIKTLQLHYPMMQFSTTCYELETHWIENAMQCELLLCLYFMLNVERRFE